MLAKPLEIDAYRPYGDVIASDTGCKPIIANQGTAERFDHLGKLENLRPKGALANICVFRCAPFTGRRLEVALLERHPFSTQVLVPMGCADRYLVVVCQGKSEPDLSTLRAFIARKDQGISYAPGTWHHPLIALEQATDFACVVFEDGGAGDCETKTLAKRVTVEF